MRQTSCSWTAGEKVKHSEQSLSKLDLLLATGLREYLLLATGLREYLLLATGLREYSLELYFDRLAIHYRVIITWWGARFEGGVQSLYH
jgi:hypothetical protein